MKLIIGLGVILGLLVVLPAAEYVFNLSDEVLAVNNAIASQVSLYPNPVNNVLNVSIPSSIQIEGATMYDILGKGTQVEISANNTINTSSLASRFPFFLQ